MDDRQSVSTRDRFNAISWHDSKLVSLSIYRFGEQDFVKITLELISDDGSLGPAEVVFKNSGYFEADIFLRCKTMCADDISDAECLESSNWKTHVLKPGPYDPVQGNRGMDDLLHFRISLCPPSGTINLLAADFSLGHLRPPE